MWIFCLDGCSSWSQFTPNHFFQCGKKQNAIQYYVHPFHTFAPVRIANFRSRKKSGNVYRILTNRQETKVYESNLVFSHLKVHSSKGVAQRGARVTLRFFPHEATSKKIRCYLDCRYGQLGCISCNYIPRRVFCKKSECI